MITDRDIAVRGVAEGRSPDTPVREVMSADVHYGNGGAKLCRGSGVMVALRAE